MSDFLATALGLVFTLVVCLLAIHALLSPWLRLRLRRAPVASNQHPEDSRPLRSSQSPDTTPAH